MAQTNAYSIFKADGETPETLAESYANIIDLVQKSAVSIKLKNTELSGDPRSGSVVVRRLEASLVKAYGTARTAEEGDKLINAGVTVNLDQRKEIVKEVNRFDMEQFGIPGMIDKQALSFSSSMTAHLDRAFFTEAEEAGTEVDLSGGATTVAKLEALIQAVEGTTNDHVDGVDRGLIAVSLKPEVYGELETYIDTLANPAGVKIATFHGVEVYSNHRQTEDAIAMMKGAVAQPVAIVDFKTADIDFSNEIAMMLFFNYGTKAVMADLIAYGAIVSEVSA